MNLPAATVEHFVELFRAGRAAEAVAGCRALLAAGPGRCDVLVVFADMLSAIGQTGEAIQAWEQLCRLQPDDAAVRRRLGGALLSSGRPAQAVEHLRHALAIEPDNTRALNNLGQALTALGEPHSAIAPLSRAVALDPQHAIALCNLATAQRLLGRTDDARDNFSRAISIKPDFYEALLGLGRIFAQAGEHTQALLHLERACGVRANSSDALRELGQTLLRTARFAAALDVLSRAAALAPTQYATRLAQCEALCALGRPEEAALLLDALPADLQSETRTLSLRGKILARLDRLGEATATLGRIGAGGDTDAGVQVARGTVALACGEPTRALQALDAAVRLAPALGEPHALRGFALERLGMIEAAVGAHSRAVELGWQDADTLYSVGALMVQLNRFENARAAFSAAAQLRPEDWRAAEGIALTLVALRRFEEAVPALERVFELAPWVRSLRGQLFHARLQCCDWTDYVATTADIAARVRAGQPDDLPFSFLAHSTEPRDQLICARTYAAFKCRDIKPLRRRERTDGRIRVAYLSADFHDHATAFLGAGLFESHDRQRFQVSAISYGPPDGGPMRRRLAAAFERFTDVAGRTDAAIAGLIDEWEIDIAIDMKGYTTGGRPAILAHRPAPVQVAFLAFPGTMGTDFIDYIVADRHVIPPDALDSYAEAPIWMPHCYQVNEPRSLQAAPTRRSAGLPETGIVFCCFNTSYKISPPVFGAWMRILAKVENSVLWLLEGNPRAVANLRATAVSHGVAPQRIVFAGPLPPVEHWARVALADLFLDTYPCNAHTTASDALWAGVPVITMPGRTFASRVAASLLSALGLGDLCADSLTTFEHLAVALARTPQQLADVRARLQTALRAGPVFNAAAYCASLESAFTTIHERNRRGERPTPLDVGFPNST